MNHVNQKIIDALREKVSKLTELPEDLQQAKAVMVKKYNDVLSGSTLSYDPLTPPSQDLVDPNIALKYAKKQFIKKKIEITYNTH